MAAYLRIHGSLKYHLPEIILDKRDKYVLSQNTGGKCW